MSDVWFGTKANMQWVPAPATDIDATKQGYGVTTPFLSGGVYVRRSKTAAKRYAFSWNLKPREEIQPILDYADGVYGDGFIYYLDPFAMDRNVLPSYWASPFLNCYDGPLIVDGVRPELVTAASIINGYPLESARYYLYSNSVVPKLYVPVPPGYTAHIGAHGAVESGSANVHLTYGGSDHNLTLLSVASSTRTNATVSGTSYSGFELSFSSGTSGILRLDGIIVQVLPSGAVSPPGGFISGQGSSGLSFQSQPVVSQYSAALDKVGVSAELIETEAWTWR